MEVRVNVISNTFYRGLMQVQRRDEVVFYLYAYSEKICNGTYSISAYTLSSAPIVISYLTWIKGRITFNTEVMNKIQ